MLLLPKAVDTLVIHSPMTLNEKTVDTFRSKTWALTSQRTHFTKQLWFIRWTPRLVTLSTTWLTKHATRTTLRNLAWPQTTTYLGNRSTSTFGADQFPFAASFNISMSRACSATSFFSRAFSFCRAFSSFVISGCIPPYF